MKLHRTYTPVYNKNIVVDLYEFTSHDKALQFSQDNSKVCETTFESSGKYYIGIRRDV